MSNTYNLQVSWPHFLKVCLKTKIWSSAWVMWICGKHCNVHITKWFIGITNHLNCEIQKCADRHLIHLILGKRSIWESGFWKAEECWNSLGLPLALNSPFSFKQSRSNCSGAKARKISILLKYIALLSVLNAGSFWNVWHWVDTRPVSARAAFLSTVVVLLCSLHWSEQLYRIIVLKNI